MNTPGPNATTSLPVGVGVRRWHAILHRWPSVLGLAAAVAVLATGADRETLSIVVCAATLCYLGAAALARPWVAWALVPGFGVVIVASDLLDRPWWVVTGVAALVLVGVGLLGRVSYRDLAAQGGAALGYGGLAVAALHLAPQAGLVLVGLVLAAHAGWDAIHYRRARVVPRSLAEACMLLDLPLGLGFLVLAAVG
ncbi:hypothetical protein [Micromonospora sp. HM5-17]|uniref:hypothetical protein n=1 Tax=Micromonospora sp. HM5-17 TaxID=2487710 RepID=UPI000F49DA6F|nr:hypothetical protein [Micromonospora sp. HM5-17]ROT33828.1 hypothetical protein EF879_02685 [Micromonospora sp. HM5-17]